MAKAVIYNFQFLIFNQLRSNKVLEQSSRFLFAMTKFSNRVSDIFQKILDEKQIMNWQKSVS